MYDLFSPNDLQHAPASHAKEGLSEIVCWSRMQAEAGQDLPAIIARKELERAAGAGLFCWGVGSAPGGAIGKLSRIRHDIDVIFSIMKSKPRPADKDPRDIVVWRHFVDYDGIERPLPKHSLITSRGETLSGIKRAHYALVCKSEKELALNDLGAFDPSAYRNVGGNRSPIGASQVTALLRRVGSEGEISGYRINIKAKLTEGYWVKLTDPLPIRGVKRSKMMQWLSGGKILTPSDWTELVAEIREGPSLSHKIFEDQLSLL